MFSLAQTGLFQTILFCLISSGHLVLGCGKPAIRTSLAGKIINGQEAVPNSWPWMVFLKGFEDNSNERLLCGGTIIDERTIVTAAHCITTPKDPSKIRIFVGLHDASKIIRNDFYDDSYDYYTPSNIHIHPKYKNDNKNGPVNDIAVLQFETNFTFSDKVSPVCMPRANDHKNLYNKNVVTTGWGRTQDGQLADRLKQANLKVITDMTKCLKNFRAAEQYCVIGRTKNPASNVCFGDSGGPLVYFDGSKWVLYGITSYVQLAENECDFSKPSYFTSVPHYLDFIYKYSVSSSSGLRFILEHLLLELSVVCFFFYFFLLNI
jgi:secreted trypsin-like serine protease